MCVAQPAYATGPDGGGLPATSIVPVSGANSTAHVSLAMMDLPPPLSRAAKPLREVESWLGRDALSAGDVCTGHRCDTGACPCGCECGNLTDPGLCYVPKESPSPSAVACGVRA